MTKTSLRIVLIALASLISTAALAQRALPTFEVDKSWPKVPDKWKLGDASSVAVDAQGNVYVLHRPRTLKAEDAAKAAPPVMVFDTAGNTVKSWGGDGAGYDWPQREHGIHIDDRGFVWIGGNNCPTSGLAGLKPVADDALLKFTLDGKFVMQIGKSNQSKGDTNTANLHRAADAQVYRPTNEVFVADGYGNHRVIVYDADTGAFKRTWGAFGKPPGGVDNCAIIGPKTFAAGDGPPDFNVAHAIRVSNDGMVYLADRENRRVQAFTIEGKFVKQLIHTATPFARDLAFSPDQQLLYVGAGKGIAVVDRKSLEIVGEIQVPGQIGPGHHIATDAKGNIYIAQTEKGLQKLTFKGMSVAQVDSKPPSTAAAKGATMPSDIDPRSGFRLPLPKREDLDDAGKQTYDRGTKPGASLAGLQGPAGIQLYTKAGPQVSELNKYLRFDAGIPPRVREIAILITAREMDSQFEWVAHEREALKEGVPQTVIDAIKYRKSTDGLDQIDAIVITLGRELWHDHKVKSQTFATAKELFGPNKLIDIVMLMGNYAGTAALLHAVDMQLHKGDKPLLPIP